VEEVLEKAEERFKERHILKAKGYNLDKLIKRVAELTQLRPEQVTDGIRDVKRTKARSILCYWATEKLGVTQSQLALILKRSQSAVVYAVRRGIDIVEANSFRIE
jgi:putative transposase